MLNKELSAKQMLLQNDQCNFCLPVLRHHFRQQRDESSLTCEIPDLILQKEHRQIQESEEHSIKKTIIRPRIIVVEKYQEFSLVSSL